MYAPERQQRILAEARRVGRVEVTALADTLGVTTETVRRDLTVLERRGSIRRVHGGAIPVERLELEPTLAARASLHTAAKRRIAARVLDEIPAGGTVVLDAGSTTQAVVELLPRSIELTVITNSIPAVALLSQFEGVTLYALGGRVRRATTAAVGPWAVDALSGIVADVAIMGTNGISVSRGLTTPDDAEAQVKHAMIAAARHVIVAADSTKVGDDHLHRFATIDEVNMLITDSELADDPRAELTEAGLEVITA